MKMPYNTPNINEFFLTENNVMQVCAKGTVKTVSDYIIITGIEHNIDSEDYFADITYKAFGEMKTLTVPRSSYLQRRKLLDLQNQGLDVTEENASLLVKYFKEEEESKAATIHFTHSSLGFGLYKGNQIFKHYHAIGVASTYNGPYDIKPHGSYSVFMKMIREEILGNHIMETILIAGLTSVLLAYLSHEFSLDSLIIHLASDSTSGKTTMLRAVSSLFSNPFARESSLFGTYNATSNSLLSRLTGLNGIPYALDEISMSNMKNFTSFIYSVVNGDDKERLTKESKLMEKKSWITTLLSSGERSLVNSANKNKGLAARVFEIKNATFTRDAENAERIQRVIQRNYGLVGPKYVEYILSLKKEDICSRFEEIREFYESVKQNHSTDELFYRRTAKFAILLLTAEYFEKFSGLTLLKEEIKDFLTSIELDSTRTRNFHDSVISYIKDYISINAAAFGLQGSGNTVSYGKVNPRKGYTEAVFYKTAFDEMLRKGHYEDSSIVLKELKANGYLDCEADRFTRSRKSHNGILQDVYVLKLTDYHLKEKPTEKQIEGDETHE